MPYFDFTLKVIPKKAKRTPKAKSTITIIDKNVEAVINITDDLKYVVVFEDGRTYHIHKDCYKCKGNKIIYSQCLVGPFKTRLIIHRIPDHYVEHKPYLPFAVGCVVIGDIIFDNVKLRRLFKIKKCRVDNEHRFANLITKAFRDTYNEELERRIIEKYSQDVTTTNE